MTTCILYTIWTRYIASNRVSVSKIGYLRLITLFVLFTFVRLAWRHLKQNGGCAMIQFILTCTVIRIQCQIHPIFLPSPTLWSSSQIRASLATMICLEQHHWLRVYSNLEIWSSDEFSQVCHHCHRPASLNFFLWNSVSIHRWEVIQQQLSELVDWRSCLWNCKLFI